MDSGHDLDGLLIIQRASVWFGTFVNRIWVYSVNPFRHGLSEQTITRNHQLIRCLTASLLRLYVRPKTDIKPTISLNQGIHWVQDNGLRHYATVPRRRVRDPTRYLISIFSEIGAVICHRKNPGNYSQLYFRTYVNFAFMTIILNLLNTRLRNSSFQKLLNDTLPRGQNYQLGVSWQYADTSDMWHCLGGLCTTGS